MMIEHVQSLAGEPISVLAGDSHLTVWTKEQGRLDTDPTVRDVLVPLIPEGGTVVDAGASIGSHTVSYAYKVGQLGRVYAFEPYRPAFEALKENCRMFPQVLLYNIALGIYPSLIAMELPEEEQANLEKNFGRARVAKNADESLRNIEMQSLDSLGLVALDFIKIDTEGMEPLVLVGARETIIMHQPIILIELNDSALAYRGHTKDSVLAILHGLGYKKPEGNPDFSAPQIDVLFRPK